MSTAYSVFSKRPIRVRDDGAPTKEGHTPEQLADLNALFADTTDDAVKVAIQKAYIADMAQPEREAWPEGAYILLKPTASGNALDMAQKLRWKPNVSANTAGTVSFEASMDVMYQPKITAAVYIVGFACTCDRKRPELAFFEDPETCETDPETAEPVAGTGQVYKLPPFEDMKARIAAAGELPAQILNFVQEKVNEMISDPLPIRRPESTSAESSGPASPPTSSRKGKETLQPVT